MNFTMYNLYNQLQAVITTVLRWPNVGSPLTAQVTPKWLRLSQENVDVVDVATGGDWAMKALHNYGLLLVIIRYNSL